MPLLPLEALSYEVEVVGPLAEVVVHQRFANASTSFLDATYLYPLAPDATIDHMVLRVGDRVITSEIRPKEQARAIYEQARQNGQMAALSSQRAPGLFSQEVSNLAPWTSVDVELSFVGQVQEVDGGLELVIPLASSPRLETAGQSVAVKTAMDALRPQVGVPVDIRVAIHAGDELSEVASPSHAIDAVIRGDEASARVEDVAPERDFVLRWQTVQHQEPALSLLVGDDQAMLQISPPELAFAERVPREIVWVGGATGSSVLARIAADARDAVRGSIDWEDSFREAASLAQALDLPAVPGRYRTIVVAGTGAFADDSHLLARVAATRGIHVDAIGLGPVPNREWYDELARAGGGAAVFVSDGESVELAAERIAEALAPPLLTDVRVDWGDCAGDEVSPERFPDVLAGVPQRALAHVTSCFGPVWVSAISNGRRTEWAVWPEYLREGRALAVAWAQARVRELERRHLYGEAGDVSAAVREIGLRWRIVTSETSFVGVDAEVRDATTILSKDYLQKVPAGRSYQEAIATTAGVTWGNGGNPNIGGGGYSGSNYMLDGATITDPVTGTFSVHFNFDAMAQVDSEPVVAMPENAAGSVETADSTKSGTNTLDYGLAPLVGVAGGGSWARVSTDLSGPIVRDKAWLSGSEVFAAESYAGSRRDESGVKATFQPSTSHRFTALGSRDQGAVLDLHGADWSRVSGMGRWQWFLSQRTNLDTSLRGGGHAVGVDVGRDWGASTKLQVLGLKDPIGGMHDLKFGIEALHWTSASRGGTVGSAFAQDSWKPLSNLAISGGAAVVAPVDAAPSVLPRLGASWDPFGDQKTRIAAGLARYVDDTQLEYAGAATRTEEAAIIAEREVIHDLAVFAHGQYAREDLPFAPALAFAPEARPPFPLVSRDVASLELGLRKIWSYRWEAHGSWTWTWAMAPDPHLLTDPAAPWVAGFLLPYRAHRLVGAVAWDLPTDPHTTRLGVSAAWASGIGQGGWWLRPTSWLGIQLEQQLDARKGAITLRGEADRSLNDASGSIVPLEALALDPAAPDPGEQPAWRWSFGAEYRF
jgi:Ca-activated chloride channel family protein